jgi:hypothetical protein
MHLGCHAVPVCQCIRVTHPFHPIHYTHTNLVETDRHTHPYTHPGGERIGPSRRQRAQAGRLAVGS